MTQLVLALVLMYSVVGSATWWFLKKKQSSNQNANGGMNNEHLSL